MPDLRTQAARRWQAAREWWDDALAALTPGQQATIVAVLTLAVVLIAFGQPGHTPTGAAADLAPAPLTANSSLGVGQGSTPPTTTTTPSTVPAPPPPLAAPPPPDTAAPVAGQPVAEPDSSASDEPTTTSTVAPAPPPSSPPTTSLVPLPIPIPPVP